MMLTDRPEEQSTLFKEIMFKRLTVRETEMIARKIAVERARKKERAFDPEILEIEQKLSETFGTRVSIEQKQKGGKITIDFFSPEDLKAIMNIVGNKDKKDPHELMKKHMEAIQSPTADATGSIAVVESKPEDALPDAPTLPIDDRSKEEKKEDENTEDLYSMKNFSL